MATSKILPLVVLDPGHGGKDPGATCGNLKEAEMVLTFAKLVAKAFETAGCCVVLTRTDNSYVDLADRTKLERSIDAACIISLHMDWAKLPMACGVNIWLHSNAPPGYEDWAQNVLAELCKAGYTDNRASPINKGYRDNPQGNYAINRDTNSPSMLLELGFITNPDNARDIVAKGQEYANAIVAATCRFLEARGYTIPQPPVAPQNSYTAEQYNSLLAEKNAAVELANSRGNKLERIRKVGEW